ncbi:MAG: hypothetical protein BGN82_00830 [Alphaproteobacteria bacterium 65-7]|nr:MAG: hypothetical protein BGN82_00830 [Alphaproteobacteria bacterium 65-7]
MSRPRRRVLVPQSLPAVLRTGAPPSAQVARLGGETMGTSWSVVMTLSPGSVLADVEAALTAMLDRLVAQMSHWRPDSHLTRFNRAPAESWHDLPPDFQVVTQAALRVAAESDGAFDPSLGALVNLWGFGPSGPRAAPPPQAAVEALLAQAGWRRLMLEGARLKQPGGLHLDYSGIAKGHAVDCLSRLLTTLGIRDHLAEIGGELRGAGVKPDGAPWWVGLDSGAGSTETVVALHGLSIATSGSERGFVHDGRAYGHTLDPRTGAPLENNVASVTVLHPECLLADAYATALMVMGADRGLAFAADHGLAALFVLRDGQGLAERLSPACQAMLD